MNELPNNPDPEVASPRPVTVRGVPLETLWGLAICLTRALGGYIFTGEARDNVVGFFEVLTRWSGAKGLKS